MAGDCALHGAAERGVSNAGARRMSKNQPMNAIQMPLPMLPDIAESPPIAMSK